MENKMTLEARIGGHILVDQLVLNGCELAFGVPGESYLAALDGFYKQRDKAKFIVCRHEGAATNMAEAYGKMTGRPGIAFVTRGRTHRASRFHADDFVHRASGQRFRRSRGISRSGLPQDVCPAV
jgi:Thiamine pyrophosphate enzyme, N-terminal TPP binding domain